MKKFMTLLAVLALATASLTGCAPKEEPAPAETPAETTEETTEAPAEEATEEADVVTTASIVTDADALVNALSAEGTWIAATLNDITVDQEIVVDGEFTNKDKIARKLGLYTQDEDRNITASFKLTAPKMTVKSENFRIQGGTFVGDVYVEANGFNLRAGGVDGDVYFATKEALDTFLISDDAFITGTVKVDGVDVVTSASLVTDANDLVAGLSADGTWIVAVYNNMALKQDIIVEGEFVNREEIARKLALYTQDEERNITASFTVSAPKMVVKSENFRLQGGTFKGDVIVEANGFNMRAATIDGNLYFASQEAMDSIEISEDSTVTGETAVQ